MRIITVGLIWSVFFLEGVRVIMLKNWRFDLLRASHWEYARDLWLSGWVIKDAKEWAFVLIILTFIPLWLTGWATLSLINYSKLLMTIFGLPIRIINRIFYNKAHQVANKIAVKTVVKKKSYKEIRPISRDGSHSGQSFVDSGSLKHPPVSKPTYSSSSVAASAPNLKKSNTFDHALFDFGGDDEDDFDFDLDAPIVKPDKPQPKPEFKKNSNNNSNNKQSFREDKNQNKKEPPKEQAKEAPKEKASGSANSVLEVVKQKGYDFITSVTIKGVLIDFVAFSKEKIALLLVDKEPGDWLADEEKFNGEEPLWFSESSHRVSPVRRVEIIKDALSQKLKDSTFNQTVQAFVVNQAGNIINAEDMFETWEAMGIEVTRIDRGTPKELKLFSKTLESSEGNLSQSEADKLKKLLRGIN